MTAAFMKILFYNLKKIVLKFENCLILRTAKHETERADHDFCLSRSHYADNDSTDREKAATAGIEPRTSSPAVARSTD